MGITITEIGDYIRTLRGKRSLREIERLSGVSNTYLSSIEKGRDPRTKSEIIPSPDILRKLAEPLGTTYEDLLQKAGYLNSMDQALEISESLLNKLLIEGENGIAPSVISLTSAIYKKMKYISSLGTVDQKFIDGFLKQMEKYVYGDLMDLSELFSMVLTNFPSINQSEEFVNARLEIITLLGVLMDLEMKNRKIDQLTSELNKKLSITSISNQTIDYNGHELTEHDKQRLLDMLPILYPEYQSEPNKGE